MASLRIFGVADCDRRHRSSIAVGSIVGVGFATAIGLSMFGGGAIFAQEKPAFRASNDIIISEFMGYADWQEVGVSRAGDLIEVTLANPVMISAHRAGVPGNGRPFPDGSKAVKLHWKANNGKAPELAAVPEVLHDVDFAVRDSKRFAETGGWGHAQFGYDAVSGRFVAKTNVARATASETAGRLATVNGL
jgi:hypothetical protein